MPKRARNTVSYEEAVTDVINGLKMKAKQRIMTILI